MNGNAKGIQVSGIWLNSGSYSAPVANQILLTAATAKIGIGTASPATNLDVDGNAQFGSGATKSTFTTTGNLNLKGYGTAAGQPGNHAYRSGTDQSIPNATPTELILLGSNYALGGSSWTSRSTATVSGVYLVSCGVLWPANVTGARAIEIQKTTTGIMAQNISVTNSATEAVAQSVSQTTYLNAGESVSCMVIQNSGGALNALASQQTYGTFQLLW